MVRRPQQPAPDYAARPAVRPARKAAKPDFPEFAAARELILEEKYEAGLAAMQALDPDHDPSVASYVGLALSKLGRADEASSWYEKALKAEPLHLQALAFYGELRAERGDLGGARLNLAKIKLVCGNTNCEEYVSLAGAIAAKAR